MKRIAVVTGTRADFGILSSLLTEINKHPQLELFLIATGSHLSHDFGYTITEVEESFNVDVKIEILSEEDSKKSMIHSMGLALQHFGKVFAETSTDMLVLLGDRYEALAAGIAAHILNIPIAHIHGGEVTVGAVDDAFRHSLTKLSHLHFTSTKGHQKRVVQLGENPVKVFNVGSLALDAVRKMNLLTKEQLEKEMGVKLEQGFFIVTFHSVTLDQEEAEVQFKELLKSLDEFDNKLIIFTKANADADGKKINIMIDDYSSRKPNVRAYASLGYLKYFSLLNLRPIVIGNSSSGIIEAPSFGAPTVNIGDRQKGRECASSVLHCPPLSTEISKTIREAEIFRSENKKNIMNPYAQEDTALKMANILAGADLVNVMKKEFFDLREITL